MPRPGGLYPIPARGASHGVAVALADNQERRLGSGRPSPADWQNGTWQKAEVSVPDGVPPGTEVRLHAILRWVDADDRERSSDLEARFTVAERR